MIDKITLYILLLFTVISSFGQQEEDYNGFSSRNFMKFNSFLTVPTFSVLHRDNQTIEAIVRSSNISFEDASRLHILSYSGKMREETGAGISVFQQEIGVFKDFGAVANYAHQIQLGTKSKLALGFNFFYSRRGINDNVVITQAEDEVVSNFQDIPIVNLQPAVTYSYGKFNLGLFFEDLAYFNLKDNEFSTGLTEKTISMHAGYASKFENASGLLNNAYIRALGIARNSQLNGFSYAGNFIIDLPKAGWLKVGYDNLYGLNAGIGVNVSEKIAIGFSYEKRDVLGVTNEVGILYNLGRKKSLKIDENKPPNITIELPPLDKEEDPKKVQNPKRDNVPKEVSDPGRIINPKNNNDQIVPVRVIENNKDLSGEVQRAQDSIDRLNKKVEDLDLKLKEIINLIKNQPKQVETIREVNNIEPTKQTVVEPLEDLDDTLKRSDKTPWRDEVETISGGGGGTMYYVAVDQFQDVNKAKALVALYKKRKVKVKYVREPKTRAYFVYVNRHAKKEDAEKEKNEVNGARKSGINDGSSDEDEIIKAKPVYKDPVYVVKITFGAAGETYKRKKTQAKARIRTTKLIDGLEPGYYIQANVFSKKPYADRFLDELRRDGINANFYINPTTGYRHVYLFKTDDRSEAIRMYNNNLDNSYYDRKSIINIR